MSKHEMTERGLHLLRRWHENQGRPRPKCKDCGLKIRGKDHVNGSHHRIHMAKRMKPAN